MTVPDFHAFATRLRSHGIKFIIEPHLRFQGKPGEQWTMFFKVRCGRLELRVHCVSVCACLCMCSHASPLFSQTTHPGVAQDPSGNNLEFKAMSNPDNLFAKYYVPADSK
eukprot:Opistho-2@10993